MKTKLFFGLALVGLLIFTAACGPASGADASSTNGEEEHMDGDEHMDEGDDTHNPDDHMAGAHNVPEEAAAVPNPISASDDNVDAGSGLYAANCAVCHGEEGRGDGPSAEGLEKKPADLNADHVQGLTDGALFYIISHGKPDTPMPAWEGVLGVEERWNVVNFMRTLSEHEDVDDHHEDVDDHHEGGEEEHEENEHSD